ncbi:GNAT family N-acetyltransferase [Porphyromonas levii]|uniref:GNAT family N-acetyltransferase n=1 Tax=Porphyromonas levii TaxID=28114 RepID=A0A4Y8WQ17_9PORP|nr:GNAT family N-acetyltransferase [Porphyromonas levii]MBR8774723.1 hypothetical protein [Porphyromonas levii]TFH95388.1 GNAT family N-acetyltransferase [Porphyromonas levii]TFH97562.1 GNAT family N-acetyltransferase [Porphyromonas levii]
MKRISYRSDDTRRHQEIVELLCESFGAKYRDYYLLQLEHLPTPQHTKLLADDEGRLVAFTQIVDYKLRLRREETSLRAGYLYSVCTAERAQGQGVMKWFMEEMLEELRMDGYALAFLVPAEDWLVAYYKRFGFVWQGSTIYEKAPKDATPLLFPDLLARNYLEAVNRYEQKHLSQKQYENQQRLEWIPMLPAPICWMSLVLQPGLSLPEPFPLLNPLT